VNGLNPPEGVPSSAEGMLPAKSIAEIPTAVSTLSWLRTPLQLARKKLQQREDQVFLALALVIGALTGLAVVAFILLTERMGMRIYPPGSAA